MKKLLALTGIMMLILALSSICFADVVGVHSRTAIYVTMTEPTFNKVVPTDLDAGSSVTVSNIVWKDSNGKVLANTDKITAGGTYTVSFDLNRKTGDVFRSSTRVFINNNSQEVQTSFSSSDKMSASKSFKVAGGRLSNAHGKADYLEGGEASTATTEDGKKVLGLVTILINGKVEEGKALPTSFQLKTDLDTSYRTYSAGKTTPSDTTKPYAVWQQFDEKAQAGKSYTLRYIFPIASDVSVADDCRITVDGKTVAKTGLAGNLILDVTYKAGESLAASQVTYIKKVEFEDYAFPVVGQEYNASAVKLKSNIPGTISAARYAMFNKEITGKAGLNENVGLEITVKANSGYEFSSDVTATIADVTANVTKISATEYKFVFVYQVKAGTSVKITEQSPETIEYKDGDKVELFVKVDGEATYQWLEETTKTSSGGAKAKYEKNPIEGATKSTYTIEKATKDMDGYSYICVITGKDKAEIRSNAIALKLIEAEEEKKPEETKPEEKVETITWAKASKWAIDELTKANDAGLIPTIFDKEDLTKNITRKEFAHVAVKLYEKISGKKAEKVEKNPFTDTKDEEVLKAYNVGITAGMSATTFEPDTLITREQMATMMTRALSKAGIDTKVDLEKVKKFDDDAEMHSWGKESIYYMSNIDIIKGMGDNKFGVLGNATREQSLLISVRSAEKFAKK